MISGRARKVSGPDGPGSWNGNRPGVGRATKTTNGIRTCLLGAHLQHSCPHSVSSASFSTLADSPRRARACTCPVRTDAATSVQLATPPPLMTFSPSDSGENYNAGRALHEISQLDGSLRFRLWILAHPSCEAPMYIFVSALKLHWTP